MGKGASSIVPFLAGMLMVCASSVSTEANGAQKVAADDSGTRLTMSELKKTDSCNLFKGKWVWDESYPMYNSSACPFIPKEFDCIKYGRPNQQYLTYRWQPKHCNLPRFNGKDFLKRLKGKMIMFIGDSLSENNFNSLLCLLSAAAPGRFTTEQKTINSRSFTVITFQDYGVEVMLFTSLYLVDIEKESIGRVLKLGSIKDGEIWKQADVLIFNTWLWWRRTGPKQPWDFIEDGNKIVKDMDRVAAFQASLKTWTKWVETQVDHNKTKVFFQAVSTSHYNGTEWGEPGVKNCLKQTTPVNGSSYPAGLPLPVRIVKGALKKMRKPVKYLDITVLSQLRKDGHPSMYNGFKGMDCTHWCVGGVPDTWNQLLYALLVSPATK
ncbi:PREDICTED: protein trichome birefringence-like 41 [Ipomoea nil]|uniref:protein trichome birefringence-like 41 n=1 Tax=Ipomoea nil TaxID=35883 RepID=UPI000900C2C9|nr:PREDICTED: protein trichome birefringence-like 41 [Ipomoea nil]